MAYLRRVSKNSQPRLAVDASGRFWLAFRTPHPTWWNPIGSVWTEYLLSFDGKAWTSPIFLNHSDNLLDNQSYEMPGSPRSSSEKDSIGGWRPKGYVSDALNKGYRLGFEASSDHDSTHISYSILYVKDLTRESVLEALQKRHAYAALDNILADVESGSHMMGTNSPLPIRPP